MNEPKKINEQIKKELLESFRLYANADYTGNKDELPVSKIIFSAQGEITTPPDLEFMGYGLGSEGEVFEACGGLDLSYFFPLNKEENDYAGDVEECFKDAATQVLEGLEAVAESMEFRDIPKNGPVVFTLNLEDQMSKVLCRIHPDGKVELPPQK